MPFYGGLDRLQVLKKRRILANSFSFLGKNQGGSVEPPKAVGLAGRELGMPPVSVFGSIRATRN